MVAGPDPCGIARLEPEMLMLKVIGDEIRGHLSALRPVDHSPREHVPLPVSGSSRYLQGQEPGQRGTATASFGWRLATAVDNFDRLLRRPLGKMTQEPPLDHIRLAAFAVWDVIEPSLDCHVDRARVDDLAVPPAGADLPAGAEPAEVEDRDLVMSLGAGSHAQKLHRTNRASCRVAQDRTCWRGLSAATPPRDSPDCG